MALSTPFDSTKLLVFVLVLPAVVVRALCSVKMPVSPFNRLIPMFFPLVSSVWMIVTSMSAVLGVSPGQGAGKGGSVMFSSEAPAPALTTAREGMAGAVSQRNHLGTCAASPAAAGAAGLTSDLAAPGATAGVATAGATAPAPPAGLAPSKRAGCIASNWSTRVRK